MITAKNVTEIGKDVALWFSHDKDTGDGASRSTTCTILAVDSTKPIKEQDPTVVAKGKATNFRSDSPLKKSDNFNKDVGRKIALTRALAKSKLGRDSRAKIWEAYRSRS